MQETPHAAKDGGAPPPCTKFAAPCEVCRDQTKPAVQEKDTPNEIPQRTPFWNMIDPKLAEKHQNKRTPTGKTVGVYCTCFMTVSPTQTSPM